jgi:hypothetical protein
MHSLSNISALLVVRFQSFFLDRLLKEASGLADTGAMSLAQRQMALKRISQDAQCKVILISIKAGGTGKFFVRIVDLPFLMVKQG